MVSILKALKSNLRLRTVHSFMMTLCLALAVSNCALVSPIPEHDKDELEKHYILVHEEGFPVRIEPGVLWDSRKEMTITEFDEGSTKFLGRSRHLPLRRCRSINLFDSCFSSTVD